MRFIDVTRYGGMRVQRLSIAAIAYLDAVEHGCAIHLIGGETLRVNEDPAEIEVRANAQDRPGNGRDRPVAAQPTPARAPSKPQRKHP